MTKDIILGVDLGIKRTGLAISDALQIGATALPVLTPKSRAEDIAYLLHLCQERQVSIVLIGYPKLPVSQEEGMMAKRARGFADALLKAIQAKCLQINVLLVDEYLSSSRAASRLRERGVKPSHMKQHIDSEAARVFVEEYMAGLPT